VRRILALAFVLPLLAASGCAVGVRQPTTHISKTSGLMHGSVLSTSGGAGSYYFEFDGTKRESEPVELEAGKPQPVEEGAIHLQPGTPHSYRLCAEDSENPGHPFCSPLQQFRTRYDVQLTLNEECNSLNGPGVHARVTGLPPNTEFELFVILNPANPNNFSLGPQESGPDGNSGDNFLTVGSTGSGTWTFTVRWREPSVSKTITWNCNVASP
jgi:hypothetical protein